MKELLLIALFGLSGILFSQTICTGTPEQCREAQTRLCAEEQAPANLQIKTSKTIAGTVIDQTGAAFEKVAVQLRSPGTGDVLRTSPAVDGKFSLGKVQAGSYRLIVVQMQPSGPQRLKMFDQSESLSCTDIGTECRLTVMPKVHGTDNPIDDCPPK